MPKNSASAPTPIDAGDAVQRLHLDQQSEHADREQQPADLRIGREARELFAERIRLASTRGAPRDAELRSAASSVGAIASAMPARTRVVGGQREDRAAAFVLRAASTVLSTIAPAIFGSR